MLLGTLFSFSEVSNSLGAELSKWFGAGPEVSGQFGTNFVVPTCLVAEVSSSRKIVKVIIKDQTAPQTLRHTNLVKY